MKFTLLATCLLGASAIHLQQKPAHPEVLSRLATDNCPSLEQRQALDADIAEAFADDGVMSLEELLVIVKKFAKRHDITLEKGWKKGVKHTYDLLDQDKNEKLSQKEFKVLVDGVHASHKEHCKKEWNQV